MDLRIWYMGFYSIHMEIYNYLEAALTVES